jgi:hypothetical protein
LIVARTGSGRRDAVIRFGVRLQLSPLKDRSAGHTAASGRHPAGGKLSSETQRAPGVRRVDAVYGLDDRRAGAAKQSARYREQKRTSPAYFTAAGLSPAPDAKLGLAGRSSLNRGLGAIPKTTTQFVEASEQTVYVVETLL